MKSTVIKAFTRVRNLSNIKRCALYPVIKPQSVAEHSYYVAVLALIVGNELKDKINIEKLVRMAISHDIEEVLVSDIPFHVKKEISGLQQYLERSVDEELGGLPDIIKDIVKNENDGSFEYTVLKACDYTELYFYTLEEMLLGNLSVKYMNNNCRIIVNTLNQTINSKFLETAVKTGNLEELRNLFYFEPGNSTYNHLFKG